MSGDIMSARVHDHQSTSAALRGPASWICAALLLCGCGSGSSEPQLQDGACVGSPACVASGAVQAVPAAASGGTTSSGVSGAAAQVGGAARATPDAQGTSGANGATATAAQGAGGTNGAAATGVQAANGAAASGGQGASGAAASAAQSAGTGAAANGAQSNAGAATPGKQGTSGTAAMGVQSAGVGAAASGMSGATGASGSSGAATALRRLPAGALALRFADAVLSRWPNPANIAQGPLWEYNHGIVMRGIEQVYKRSGDEKYLRYLQRYVDAAVSSNGSLSLPAEHSFDDLQPAVLLPTLFEATGEAKYKTAAASVRARYDNIPRNMDRGFWHKQKYPNQMWLDSIYMGEPFLARYARVFDCGAFCFDTIVEQVLLLAAHTQDAATGLLFHAWDDSPAGQKAAWANASSGRSPAVWGRGLGWYAMSLVDLLQDLPADHPGRPRMLDILGQLASGLQRYQDAQTGLWFQVVDQGDRSDNWLETSGSAMFVYALKVGVDSGYLDASYSAVAQHGFEGLRSQVSERNQMPSIQNAVQGMGVQNDYAGYVNQTKLTDSAHGLCAILLAASEMEIP